MYNVRARPALVLLLVRHNYGRGSEGEPASCQHWFIGPGSREQHTNKQLRASSITTALEKGTPITVHDDSSTNFVQIGIQSRSKVSKSLTTSGQTTDFRTF